MIHRAHLLPCTTDLQLEAEYKKAPVGVKAGVQGITASPKVSGSACLTHKGFSVGGEASIKTGKGNNILGAYSAGMQYSQDQSTVAVIADGVLYLPASAPSCCPRPL